MRNALWTVTSHHDTINRKASHQTNLSPIPEMWAPFRDYYDWKKGKRKKPERLKSSDLKSVANSLFSLLTKSMPPAWSIVWKAVEGLATCLSEYATYLDGETANTQKRHSLDHPPRQVCALIKSD